MSAKPVSAETQFDLPVIDKAEIQDLFSHKSARSYAKDQRKLREDEEVQIVNRIFRS